MLTSNFEPSPFPLPWRPVNFPTSVQMNVVQNASIAYSGSGFLRASTTQPGGSVAVDEPLGSLQPLNISVFAWVRTPGPATLDGSLAIWQLAPGAPPFNATTSFTAVAEWSLVSNVLILQPGGSGPPTIRVEFYMNTIITELYIDNVIAVVGL